MVKYFNLAGLLLLLLHLGTLLTSLACPTCPYQTPPPSPKLPPKLPPKHPSKPPPKVLEPPPSPPKYPPIVLSPPPPPPYIPKPPIVKPPIVKPPFFPKPPMVMPPNVPKTPSPPIVVPTPPIVVPKPPPVETPCPPPPPRTTPVLPYPPPSPPKAQQTCPIDTLKLGACVDLLGGLIHIGIGGSAKDTCCPVLDGLVDLDAALCLCTTIKAKLLNVNILLPIALEVLIDCGKTPPSGFQCPS